jgi:hypothetical protein
MGICVHGRDIARERCTPCDSFEAALTPDEMQDVISEHPVYCGHASDGHVCSRPPGHDGRHVATAEIGGE